MQRALSMRRLAAVTLVVFVLMLAFLAGRVRAGADPTQASTPASSQTHPDTTPATPDGGSADPSGTGPSGDPYGTGPYTAPYGGGSAVPDTSPPVTHAS